jgi:hypothetical protein
MNEQENTYTSKNYQCRKRMDVQMEMICGSSKKEVEV